MPRRTTLVPMGRQFRRKRGATRRTMLARCFGRTVLPPFSLPFFPLLSSSFTHRFTDVPFPFFPSVLLTLTYSYLLLLLPPSILFSLRRLFHLVSILERETQPRARFLRLLLSRASPTLSRFLLLPTLSSFSFSSFFLSPRCCATVTFPFRIVALLPFYHLAEQQLVAQRRSLDGDKGPSYRS